MKKFIVETYYTCTFKTVHTLDDLNDKELSKIDTVPSSLNDSLNALKADKDYLLAGGVFTEDFIDNFIDIK